jgi:SAM-dependent methyltransferase
MKSRIRHALNLTRFFKQKWITGRTLLKGELIRIKNRMKGGIPIPPFHLIYLVAGTNDIPWFLRSGELAARSMQDILKKNGLDIERFGSILDFGCGVGRVIRHWNTLKGPVLFGTDYNRNLIAWCQNNLRFANFQTNPFAGGLDCQDGKFDFIYALSVFTHLTEPQQFFWIKELSRVLRPGGYLFITVHGEKFYLPQILPEDQGRFKRGELIVYGSEHEGSNVCVAFHPEEYVRHKIAKDLIVVDYLPEGALGNPRQDVYFLKKPTLSYRLPSE